jgi:hypothetical protein
MAVNEAEVDRLCEELHDHIELGAGLNPAALSQARRIIKAFHSTGSGDHVHEQLVGLALGFEQWFSFRKWNRRDDGGKLVKRYLGDNLINLKAAMAMGRISRGGSGSYPVAVSRAYTQESSGKSRIDG